MCFQCGCTTKGTSKEGQGESFSGTTNSTEIVDGIVKSLKDFKARTTGEK